MRRNRRKIITLTVLASLMLASGTSGCGDGGGGSSSGETKATAVEMRLQRTAGTVKLTNDKGEEQTLMEKMRLAAGNALETAKESLANVSLDDTKLVTVDEVSRVQINGNSQNLEIDCKEGNLFINITEKVPEGSSLDIRVGNIVCGSRATSGCFGQDEDGNDQVMTTDGEFSVTATGQDGQTIQETAGPGEKIVVKKGTGTGSGPSINLEKSKYKAEELPPIALDAISKDEGLLGRVTGSTQFSEEKIKLLAKATSRASTDWIKGTIPILGHEGKLLSKAAAAAEEIAGGDIKLQAAIVNEVKNALEEAREKGASDEELTKTAETTTENLKQAVQEMEAAGLSKDEITKRIEGTGGSNTPPSTAPGNTPGSTTGADPQGVPGNVTGEARQTEGNTGDDDDSGSGSGAGIGTGTGTKKQEDTPTQPDTPVTPDTPTEPETPTPAPQPSEEEKGQEEPQQIEPKTTGTATSMGGGMYQASLSNGTVGTFYPASDTRSASFNITNYTQGSPLELPISITMPDGSTSRIESITSIRTDNVANVEIHCNDSAATIVTHAKQNWSEPFKVSNGTTTIIKAEQAGDMSAEVEAGTVDGLLDFIGAFHGTGLNSASYGGQGGIMYNKNDTHEIISKGPNVNIDFDEIEKSTSDYVQVRSKDGASFRLHTDATITLV